MVRDVQLNAQQELWIHGEDSPPMSPSDDFPEPHAEQPWIVTAGIDQSRPPPAPAWRLRDNPWALRVVLAAALSVLFSVTMISLTEACWEDHGAHAQGSTGGAVQARRAGSHDSFHFECVTVTLLQEAMKLAVAWTFFRSQVRGGAVAELKVNMDANRLRYFLRYSIPGLLYCVDNNFQYLILGFLQPAELAVLWNFKMFATAVLLHTFLQQRYAGHQWGAMVLLVVGCALTQVSNLAGVPGSGVYLVRHQLLGIGPGVLATVGGEAEAESRPLPSKLVGAGLAIIGSSIAATSNVYCEWLVKQQPEESIHLQNMQLYFFGVLWNSLALLVKVTSDADSPLHGHGFFTGYNVWVWIIVLLGVVSGLSISVALKHVDNLVVVFAHALAVVFVAAISVELFDQKMSNSFAGGGVLILVALCVFHSVEHCDKGEVKLDGGWTWRSLARVKSAPSSMRSLTPSLAGSGARPLANLNTPMYCLA